MNSNPPNLPFVSVAICTYNRARWLRETLECLTRQDYPSDLWEVLVVDNNSTDETRSVVDAFSRAPKPPRYFLEKNQGSSHARNRGIAEARGEIVVFTDDDMLGSPEWLRRVVHPFLLPGNENVAAVGGEVVPVFPDGLPAWLERYWRPLEFRQDVGPLRPNQLPMTANLAIRAAVFRKVGLFRTDLGRIGNHSLFNEDHEMCRRIFKAGYEMWYSPDAVLQHQIPAARLTFRYTLKQVRDAARSRVVESTTYDGKGMGWLLSRLAVYPLHMLVYAIMSLLCLLCLRPGLSKRYIVRLARGYGYVVESFSAIRRIFTSNAPSA